MFREQFDFLFVENSQQGNMPVAFYPSRSKLIIQLDDFANVSAALALTFASMLEPARFFIFMFVNKETRVVRTTTSGLRTLATSHFKQLDTFDRVTFRQSIGRHRAKTDLRDRLLISHFAAAEFVQQQASRRI